VNNKADGEDGINNTIPLCFCDKASSHGSCTGRPNQLLPMHISEGDEMLVTMTEGENENPLLQQATIQLTTGSAYPLPSGNQQEKWLLQENHFLCLVTTNLLCFKDSFNLSDSGILVC
jgi:hypothetical protein